MDVYMIVKKLIGEINPVGETNTDHIRFHNLQEMTQLVDKLLTDMNYVAQNKGREEFSMNKAGQFAGDFLDSIGIVD